jgi:hypothetical protein
MKKMKKKLNSLILKSIPGRSKYNSATLFIEFIIRKVKMRKNDKIFKPENSVGLRGGVIKKLKKEQIQMASIINRTANRTGCFSKITSLQLNIIFGEIIFSARKQHLIIIIERQGKTEDSAKI